MGGQINKIFGERIKSLRDNQGLRQEDIGDWFKMQKSTVSQWESGRLPHVTILNELANRFRCSTDYLLGRTNNPNTVALPPGAEEFNDLYPVPIIGRIPAGEPILTAENIEGYEMLPVSWLNGKPEENFVLCVEGDSMEQARIYDGDKALIRKQSTFDHNGQICAVGILREEEEPYTTLKRVYELDEHYIELVPANDKYPRRKVRRGNVIIYGVLKKTIREDW